MGATRPKRYLVQCEICKEWRKSTRKPGWQCCPTTCARCNRDKNRVLMARMMKREVLRERA